jgi:hypothetical protein
LFAEQSGSKAFWWLFNVTVARKLCIGVIDSDANSVIFWHLCLLWHDPCNADSYVWDGMEHRIDWLIDCLKVWKFNVGLFYLSYFYTMWQWVTLLMFWSNLPTFSGSESVWRDRALSPLPSHPWDEELPFAKPEHFLSFLILILKMTAAHSFETLAS